MARLCNRALAAHLAVASSGIGAAAWAGIAVSSREVLAAAANLAVARTGVAGAAWAGVAVLGGDQLRIGLRQKHCGGKASKGGNQGRRGSDWGHPNPNVDSCGASVPSFGHGAAPSHLCFR